jgi:nitroreductase
MTENDAKLLKTEAMMEAAPLVAQAIVSRRSMRAFLDKPVPRETVEAILELASHAPSGSNLQPWHVCVLTGATLKRFGDAIQTAYLTDESGHQRDYNYYTEQLFEPYLARRRACGWGLYGTLGIERQHKDRMKTQRAKNYNFFGAPTGLVFTIDRRLEKGSWLDYGLFLQTIMLAARSFGLHTCPQASIAEYPNIVRRELGISDGEAVVAGMAMGFADPGDVVNGFSPTREPVSAFTTFFD